MGRESRRVGGVIKNKRRKHGVCGEEGREAGSGRKENPYMKEDRGRRGRGSGKMVHTV